MADEIRQQIVSSLFSKQTPTGVIEENYVAHMRIQENDEGGPKMRYILLSGPSIFNTILLLLMEIIICGSRS